MGDNDLLPAAQADTNTAQEGGSVVNDTVINNDGLGDEPTTVTAAEQDGTAITLGEPFTTAAGGTLTLNADGSYSYTPPAQGEVPEDGLTEVFNYTITDEDGDSSTTTLTITVGDNDLLPNAENDTASVDEDSSVNITVLDNDSFGGDGPSTGTITVNNATNGTATVNDGGTPNDPTDDTIDFTPDADYNGPATINYTITDADGDISSATVNVTVNPVDDASIDLELVPNAMLITDDGALTNGNAGGTTTDTEGAGTLFTVTSSTGTLNYILELGSNTNTNLVDVATDESVNLSLNAGVIEGRTATSNELVFTLSVDSATGAVTQTQLRAVEHTSLIDTVAPYDDDITGLGVTDAVKLTGNVNTGGDIASDSIDISSAIKFTDDGPKLDFGNLVGTGTTDPQTGFWNGGAGADGAANLAVTLDGYEINGVAGAGTFTLTPDSVNPDASGNYTYAGSITDDFDGDGSADDVLNFDLIINADGTYIIDLEEGFTSTTTVTTTGGTAQASGPILANTVTVPGTTGETIVFFGADADADTADIQSLLSLTSTQINNTYDPASGGTLVEFLEDDNQLGDPVDVNVSTNGIGVENNILNGEGAIDSFGDSGDESFVINPTTLANSFTIGISGTGQQEFKSGDQLTYKVFYDSGSTEIFTLTPTTVTSSFTIDANPSFGLIDAVQLTMDAGEVKIGFVETEIVNVNVADPVSLDFSAVLTDGDADSNSSSFSVDLLTGNSLEGGADADALTGGLGSQILTGNGGADSFIYTNVNDGNDTITDLLSGIDRIVVNNATGSGFEGLSEGTVTSFLGSASGTTAGFVYGSNQLSYWDGANEFELASGITALNPADILVI